MIMLDLLAKAIGKHPRNRDWPGCDTMAPQLSGYNAYRAMDMPRKIVKSRILSQKKIYEIYCSHIAL